MDSVQECNVSSDVWGASVRGVVDWDDGGCGVWGVVCGSSE